MVFVILAAGIILIILGIMRGSIESNDLPEEDKDNTLFDNVLSDNLVLQRLDGIDEKLLKLEDAAAKVQDMVSAINSGIVMSSISDSDVMDVNQQINLLKSKGLNVEEIAAALGIKKGEVLLRLGMKK